ncbi:MAG: hypothetical protein II795_04620 [Firmicutes bacterium]|nr:hypothetical protein [Bacillota bacterium]
MKRMLIMVLMSLCCAALFSGCKDDAADGVEKITNRNIPVTDITDFYYTYENINYNAFYQRYRFYVEDGRYMFHHETRERPGEYGPATEKDITSSGTFELTEEEWLDFCRLLKDGTVSERQISDETGDSGPWTYIYWKNDKSKYQEYKFASVGDRNAFKDFCTGLAQTDR